jgi:hypothetical protein
MKIIHNYELKEMGQPKKETEFWLFFEKGKIAKHTIESFHFKDEIQRFRAELSFNNHQPINNTIN